MGIHCYVSCCRSNFAAKLQDSEPLEAIRVTETHVRFLWRWVLMPLLFCLIGTIINFNTLPDSTIPRAVGLIFAGAVPSESCDFLMLRWSGAPHAHAFQL